VERQLTEWENFVSYYSDKELTSRTKKMLWENKTSNISNKKWAKNINGYLSKEKMTTWPKFIHFHQLPGKCKTKPQ
jgi:hypothetical protein